jgi:hypothetical protein
MKADPLTIKSQVLQHRESKDWNFIVDGVVVGSSNQVVTSQFKCAVAIPREDQIHRLIQPELVLDHFGRELRVMEDTFEGAAKLEAEFLDGLLIHRWIVGINRFLLTLLSSPSLSEAAAAEAAASAAAAMVDPVLQTLRTL